MMHLSILTNTAHLLLSTLRIHFAVVADGWSCYSTVLVPEDIEFKNKYFFGCRQSKESSFQVGGEVELIDGSLLPPCTQD